MIGACSTCGANVCRVNPRTGVAEWLDGASPWSPDDQRPMEDEPITTTHGAPAADAGDRDGAIERLAAAMWEATPLGPEPDCGWPWERATRETQRDYRDWATLALAAIESDRAATSRLASAVLGLLADGYNTDDSEWVKVGTQAFDELNAAYDAWKGDALVGRGGADTGERG